MYNGLCRIILYSHFFKIENPSFEIKKLIHQFIKPYILYEMVKAVGEPSKFMPTKVFSARTADQTEYRLHINQFQDFLNFLKNNYIDLNQFEIIKEPLYTPAKLSYPFEIKKSARDYQLKAIDYITHPKVENYPTSMIGLPTGTGKTFTGLLGASLVGTRLAIIILPTYIEKWINDIISNLNVSPRSIIVVRGLQELSSIVELGATNNLPYDYIIISTVTMRIFIDQYDENPQDCMDQIGCSPYDLYKILKIGHVLIDETHQHLHAVFKIMISMHVPKLTSLTATLISNQPVIQRVHDLIYPKACRFDQLLMEKYIHVVAISYTYNNFRYRKIRTSDFGSTTYSHTAYEKSIMRDLQTQSNYFKMIDFFITNNYISNRAQKDKAIVYVATKKMGALLVTYLQKKHPDLVTRRYMEDDPLSHIDEADIIVSTIISAGTALDIANLTHVFMTVNVSSPVANAQSLGRLRKLPDREVYFYYFYCSDIQKHKNNHYTRKDLFASSVKDIKELNFGSYL